MSTGRNIIEDFNLQREVLIEFNLGRNIKMFYPFCTFLYQNTIET
jgi:hypothetical protein